MLRPRREVDRFDDAEAWPGEGPVVGAALQGRPAGQDRQAEAVGGSAGKREVPRGDRVREASGIGRDPSEAGTKTSIQRWRTPLMPSLKSSWLLPVSSLASRAVRIPVTCRAGMPPRRRRSAARRERPTHEPRRAPVAGGGALRNEAGQVVADPLRDPRHDPFHRLELRRRPAQEHPRERLQLVVGRKRLGEESRGPRRAGSCGSTG